MASWFMEGLIDRLLDEDDDLGREILTRAVFYLVPHMNPDGGTFTVITDGWTLNYEAIFYLIFTGVLFAPARWRLGLMTTALLALPSYGYFIRQDAYIMGANMFFLQFAAGVWLAEARLRGKLPHRRTGIIVAAMALACYGLLMALKIDVYFWRPIVWGVPAVLLVTGLVSAETDGGLPRIGWLHLLGDASYSIYLAHFLFISLLAQFVRSGGWFFPPIAFAVGLAVSLICYFLLEWPLLALFRGGKLGFLPSRAI